MNKRSAFSLIELSITILVIGLMIVGITQSSRLIGQFKLSNARTITQSSAVNSIEGLSLWLDSVSQNSFATGTSTLLDVEEPENGATIGKWINKNIQNVNSSVNNATQTTLSAQPTYVTNAINDLPALSFDGGDYLLFSNLNMLENADGLTAFFVGTAPSSIPSSTAAYTVYRGEKSFTFGFGTPTSSSLAYCGRWVYESEPWKGTWYPTSATAISAGQEVICTARYNGSNIRGWTNKTGADTANSASGKIATPTQVAIGAAYYSAISISEYFNGYIGEIIIFNRSLKDEEKESVENYLKKKWNID